MFAQNLIAHYPFDNNANDISLNKNHGRIIGGVSSTADRFGNPCGAFNFNGTDGYIEVPNSTSLQSITQIFSVTCWFKIENVTMLNGIKWLTLICKGNQSVETPNNPQFRVQTFQSAIQSTISINTDFTEYDNNFSKHPFEFSKWNFYALAYDGNFVKAYLNNVKIWEFPYSKPLNINSEPMQIAKDIPGSLEFFCGSLDDLRIYNTGLTDSDISKIFKDETFASYDDEFSLTCPANITAYTEKGKCTALVNYPKPDLKETCGSSTMKQVSGLPSGSQFPIGTSFISFEASSKTGFKKTCMTKIVVIDKEPPIIDCPNDTLLTIADANITEVNFQYPIPKASDKCSQPKVTLVSNVPSSSSFPIGTTQLKFRATDNSGNTADCNYNVVVKKNIVAIVKPTPVPLPKKDTLICPVDIEKFNDSHKCGAVVNYSLNHSENEVTLLEGNKSGTFFPVGTTLNRFSIPSSKNECSFNVSVIDNEKPELVCPADIIVYAVAGQNTAKVSFKNPLAKDNCSIDSIIQLNGLKSESLFPLATTQNIFKAIDVFGNYATCSFNVTVIDTFFKQVLPDSVEIKPNLIPDSIRYTKRMDFNTCIITVLMYDDSQQDFDSISVFFNGKEIIKREMIKLKKNGTINRALMLNANEPNDFIVKAWNNGNISPNTLQIDFYEGYFMDKIKKLKNKKPDLARTLHSKPGVAAGIYLHCKNQQ